MVDHHHHAAPSGAANDDDAWDERYSVAEQLWSGQPNGALVSEVKDLAPGRALDVGCGEGADAIWLASRGWRVTAVDVSQLALQRATAVAKQAGVQVEWVHAGLLEAALPSDGFDLVTAHYAALLHTPDRQAEHALLAGVAVGGHLLVVHHADVDIELAKEHGFDPTEYVSPSDVQALLDEHEGWEVTLDERRPRHLDTGAGAGHSHDVVLHARRLP